MKKLKILLILLFIFGLSNACFSEEDAVLSGYVVFDDNTQNVVYLNDTIDKPTLNLNDQNGIRAIKAVKKNKNELINTKSVFSSQLNIPEYKKIAPRLFSQIEKNDFFSYGTTFGSDVDNTSAQLEYLANVYTRVESKHLAFTTTYATSLGNFGASDLSRSFILSPEIKLTRHLSVLDNFQVYMGRQKKKNEFVLRYRPEFRHHEDMLQMDLGAGQNYYDNGNTSSFFKFSTNFRL
ncbi:hypothetical protein IJI31_02850 [bacterium]|nr:hypothetical protein [bacterium]